MYARNVSPTRRALLAALPAVFGGLHGSAVSQTVASSLLSSPGWSLPVWTAQGGASRSVSSRELLGQWVYLDFWASWCGPCKQSFPWMTQLQSRWREHKLQVVAVGLDKQAQPMERFLQQFPGHVLVAWDPAADTAKRFDVQAMPSSYLINPEGKVILHHRGFQVGDSAALSVSIGRHVSS